MEGYKYPSHAKGKGTAHKKNKKKRNRRKQGDRHSIHITLRLHAVDEGSDGDEAEQPRRRAAAARKTESHAAGQQTQHKATATPHKTDAETAPIRVPNEFSHGFL